MSSPTGSDVTVCIVAMTDTERPFARAAIESVLRQTVPARHVWVFVANDNLWIDELAREVRGFEVHRTTLAPLGAIRNRATELAETSWVAYLDGDDMWQPDKLREQLRLARGGAALIGCDYDLCDEAGSLTVAAVCRTIPAPSSWLVERRLMLQRPFPDSGLSEDSVWWEKNLAWSFAVRLPQRLVTYRVRATSLSSGTPGKRRKMKVLRLAALPLVGPIARLGCTALHAMFRAPAYPAAGQRA